jgi:hypothetical protein
LDKIHRESRCFMQATTNENSILSNCLDLDKPDPLLCDLRVERLQELMEKQLEQTQSWIQKINQKIKRYIHNVFPDNPMAHQ